MRTGRPDRDRGNGLAPMLLALIRKEAKAVRSLLQRLLDIQYQGDKAASDEFVAQYSTWDENLHGVVAGKRKAAYKVRYWQVNYAALGE